MQLNSRFGSKVGEALAIFLLIFTGALSLSARSDVRAGQYKLDEVCRKSIHISNSTPGMESHSATIGPLNVAHAVMSFGGDHSLDVTTSAGQNILGMVRYFVQVRLDSGATQEFVVAAPPGGLRVELHDMSGDDVANDLLLRPAFLDHLPTVLLNDGHDHFTVAISANDPGSISSGQDLASRENDGHGTFGLMYTGFRMGGITAGNIFFRPSKEVALVPVRPFCAGDSEHTSSSGRAPPFSASQF